MARFDWVRKGKSACCVDKQGVGVGELYVTLDDEKLLKEKKGRINKVGYVTGF